MAELSYVEPSRCFWEDHLYNLFQLMGTYYKRHFFYMSSWGSVLESVCHTSSILIIVYICFAKVWSSLRARVEKEKL